MRSLLYIKRGPDLSRCDAASRRVGGIFVRVITAARQIGDDVVVDALMV